MLNVWTVTVALVLLIMVAVVAGFTALMFTLLEDAGPSDDR